MEMTDEDTFNRLSPSRAAASDYDAATVDLARAGDTTAFTRLFDTYHGPITGYLLRLTGNREVADDLAQETFLRVLRALPDTDEDLHFRPWLYRIATNLANSWFRRKRLRTWLPLPSFLLDSEPGSDPRLADQLGEHDQIRRAFQNIGQTHASILLLRHSQHLTLQECAEALGISPNTAKVRLYRARKAFITAYTELENSIDTSESSGKAGR